jgi:hypothetical protein
VENEQIMRGRLDRRWVVEWLQTPEVLKEIRRHYRTGERWICTCGKTYSDAEWHAHLRDALVRFAQL